MVFINTTGIIGGVISSGTANLTGGETLTILIFMLVFFLMGLMFRMPVVLTLLFNTPFIIVLMAYNSAFLLPGGIFLFILAGILTKTFILD